VAYSSSSQSRAGPADTSSTAVPRKRYAGPAAAGLVPPRGCCQQWQGQGEAGKHGAGDPPPSVAAAAAGGGIAAKLQHSARRPAATFGHPALSVLASQAAMRQNDNLAAITSPPAQSASLHLFSGSP
jgi:hypothetical protein